MSSAFARSFTQYVRSFKIFTKPTTRPEHISSLLTSHILSVKSCALSGHSRSLWYLAPSWSRSFNGKSSVPSLTCSCGGFHTESDKKFTELLKSEVSNEKTTMLEIPQLSDDWKVSINGADCSLEKQIKGDKIKILFNVNQSVPPAGEDDPDANEEIISKPDFSVEIEKPSTKDALTFDCYFPDAELEDETEYPNVFSIRSIILHSGEITEKTYSIEMENVDSEMYDSLLEFLSDRGIGSEFGDDVINLATAVENREYVKSLEKLHNFVSCK